MTPIAKAKADTRIHPLLKEAEKTHKIKFHEVEGPAWTIKIVEDTAQIGYCEAKYPASCLAHELLHIIFQGRGFRQIGIGIAQDEATFQILRFTDCLNNELQHHRIFPLFEKAKFKPDQFYNDSDADIHSYLEKEFLEFTGAPMDAVTLCFTILAPGGRLTTNERAGYEARLLDIGGGKFRDCIKAVKGSVEDWAKSESLNSEQTIRRICQAIKNPSVAWFGYKATERPPKDGFFIDQVFDVDEQ